MNRAYLAAAAAVSFVAGACSQPADPGDFAPATLDYKVETVVEGLQVPWAFAWAPDGTMLFTERPGRVRSFKDGKLAEQPVYTVPGLRGGARTEIGLMGLCLHPEYAANKAVYLSFGYEDKAKNETDVRVQRFTHENGTLTPGPVLVRVTPVGSNHAGCRIAFGPDGKLYVTTGEAFRREFARDMTSLGGKILRLNDDGSIPADNPFLADEYKAKGVRPEVFSFGHRNPQGMDWQPGTGIMFETEHGPSGEAGTGGDEFNVVEAGKDYGWPEIHHGQAKPGMESPLILWDPAVAPASGAFHNGDKFPDLKGNYLVGALGGLGGGKRPGIIRIVLDGRKVVRQERLATDLGRIRNVQVGPDGCVYFSTSNKDGRGKPAASDDRIMRLVPASP